MCIECTNNLKVFFNLKSVCVDIRRSPSLAYLKNDVELDPVKIENINDLEPVTAVKDEIRCRFCTNSKGEGLISLHESKDNIFMVDILMKHIPELNLSNIGELLTCKTCLDNIQIVLNFLTKCLDVEEKISKYTEIQGTDDNGQIELQDVQQFVFKPMLKFEGEPYPVGELTTYAGIQEEFIVKDENEATYKIEGDNLESFIKTEEVDIKSEESDYVSFQEPSAEIEWNTEIKNSLDIPVNQCKACIFETTCEKDLNSKNNRSASKIFKCEMCVFETNYKTSLKQHNLIHKSSSEITKFKCEMCEYVTMRKNSLKVHMLTHKSRSEVIMYKCDICTYEAKRKCHLNEHKLVHKDPSETTMFKCAVCTFETKHKKSLNKHALVVHKKLSNMYKCGSCTYETNYKQYLNRHELIHKSPSEVIMYKCDTCTYETKTKANLGEHQLIHKSPSEITMFKCEMCMVVTKRKSGLKRHMRTHKNPQKETKVKCEVCEYETTHKNRLKKHMLTAHKSYVVLRSTC